MKKARPCGLCEAIEKVIPTLSKVLGPRVRYAGEGVGWFVECPHFKTSYHNDPDKAISKWNKGAHR